MSNYNFGNYICELREKKGLSQSQLGEKLGVSNKAISKWENGGAYPSSELMLPLAEELGVSIETLYAAITNSKSPKTKLRLLLDSVSNKANIIISVAVLYGVVLWILFLLFGNTKDKTSVLILTPIMAILFYAFVRLMFMFFKRNPMVSAKYVDIIIFGLCVLSILLFITTIINFVAGFPNAFYPSVGCEIGLVCGLLHANNNRI